ncbi:hypothetical protein ZWY2020_051570 [Hordeum vulgare]|nr:hypothetical protein ZWY2020_051570 [Hordeum vulgare]
MPLRFLGRICGDAVGSAARRFHRNLGDEMREFAQHRWFVQLRAERDFYAGVCSEAAGSARRLRNNIERDAERLGRGLWEQKKKILDAYLALSGVNYVLKFPAEPAAIDEFAAEKALKEDAMKWRFEELWMIEHGSKYKHNEWRKVWLYDKYKKCAQDVDKRNTEAGGAAFGTDQFWDETEQEFRSRRRRELED